MEFVQQETYVADKHGGCLNTPDIQEIQIKTSWIPSDAHWPDKITKLMPSIRQKQTNTKCWSELGRN